MYAVSELYEIAKRRQSGRAEILQDYHQSGWPLEQQAPTE